MMKINKKGNIIGAVILFILGGVMIIFAVLGMIGTGLLQNDVEEQKERCIAVEGIVQELRYDNSARHYVADVTYEVNGEFYIVTLDTATSDNVKGTTMTVYYDPDDPTMVVDEWNSRETFNTYKSGLIILILGILLIFAGIKASGGLRRTRQQTHYINYNSPSAQPSDPLQTYTGYNSGMNPSQPYNNGDQFQNFGQNSTYGQTPYNTQQPYNYTDPYQQSYNNPNDPNNTNNF
ncbi:MAG: DUF3592 domain-containing protein [Clostridia bacterium]|nr:DUF3592 domain-containing protein [Clostridia bacterium]